MILIFGASCVEVWIDDMFFAVQTSRTKILSIFSISQTLLFFFSIAIIFLV